MSWYVRFKDALVGEYNSNGTAWSALVELEVMTNNADVKDGGHSPSVLTVSLTECSSSSSFLKKVYTFINCLDKQFEYSVVIFVGSKEE